MVQKEKCKRKKGIGRTLILILISLILGVNIYLWNAQNLAGKSLPMPFGYGASVVLSGSMEPALYVNDLVFLKKSDTVGIGDIVVYQSGTDLIIHRVVSINRDTVITRGDANSADDAPISRSEIKGVMIGRISYVGWIVRMLKKPVVVLAVLLAAFALTELSYRRGQRRDDEKIEAIKAEIRRLKSGEEQQKK